MGLTLMTIDAFTSEPFRGNPAAVCFLDGPRPDAWMQRVAAEMNLSETAFLLKEGDGWRLRWLTPATEVPLCGHATLASAHALWSTGRLSDGQEARFETLSGRLSARRDGDAIAMDFPALPVVAAELPETIRRALGATPVSVTRTHRHQEQNLLLELESEQAVRDLKPDFVTLRTFSDGVIVTARAKDAAGGYDFVSRYFAGVFGIDEDPVTGSAHCSLAPFWAERLGRSELTGFQCSARGGTVRCGVRGDRVLLAGRAVTVTKGELLA
ncbi:MAG TPA: PhzF family phenazine biosynthesis protein [Vicinamibacteria bacterium]|nr:PhzF family phenazine biosynthesis protein [Vicinamibacteria bacterium]